VSPHVAATPPPGWVVTEIEKPKIAKSAGAAFTTWTAARSSTDDAAFVTGCVATPIPGWVEEMRPAVEGRTVALAGASASTITGAPIDARPGNDGMLDLRAASDLAGPVIGHARTFVGFDESRVLTCFATCASKKGDAPPPGCHHSVFGARLEGALPPPQPGLALRSATWAIHHPRPVTLGVFGSIALAAVLAVAARRRPRSRMHGKSGRSRAPE
jgi:hypothetical protein